MLAKYLKSKYIEWRGDPLLEDEEPVVEFAKEIGVSQPLLSMWMNNKRLPRDNKSIITLLNYFGEEIIDYLWHDKSEHYKIIRITKLLSEKRALNLLPYAIKEFNAEYKIHELPPGNKETGDYK